MTGLQLYKFDLHTHTPASKCYLDKTHTPEQIVQAAMDQGLAAIAITDHNTADWIDRMKDCCKRNFIGDLPWCRNFDERGLPSSCPF